MSMCKTFKLTIFLSLAFSIVLHSQDPENEHLSSGEVESTNEDVLTSLLDEATNEEQSVDSVEHGSDSPDIQIVKFPSIIDKESFYFTVWCRCKNVCSIDFSVASTENRKWKSRPIMRLVSNTGEEFAFVKSYSIGFFEGNLTFIASVSRRDVYYDPRSTRAPTNNFATHIYVKVEIHEADKVMEQLNSLSVKIPITAPSDRSPLPGICMTWYATLKRSVDKQTLQMCNFPGYVEIIPSIAASPGDEAGFVRKINDVTFPAFTPEKVIEENTKNTRCTITAWFYLMAYCKKEFCGILTHRNSAEFFTPSILLNKHGTLHIQLHQQNGKGEAFLTSKVPLHRWMYIQLSIDETHASLVFADEFVAKSNIVYSYSLANPVYCKPSDSFWNAGGYHSFAGFSGFLGPCRLYRHRFIVPHDTHFQERDKKLILQSGVWQLDTKCRKVVSSVENFVTYKSYSPFLETCRFRPLTDRPLNQKKCFIGDNSTDRKKQRKSLPYRLREVVPFVINITKQLSMEQFNSSVVGEKLLAIARESMFVAEQKDVLRSLETAGCFDTPVAFYEAGAMLTAGFRGAKDQHKAVGYQLMAAMRGNGLAQLALAYKFQLGTEELIKSCTLAAGYLKSAGLLTRYLVENEKAEVHTHSELVRLDEAEKVSLFRGAKSEVVEWLSQQAERGSREAQGKIAEIFFHGHHGVNIDRNRALDFYRLGVDQGDPLALYNLGVLYLRGIEVEKNETKGMELFKRSAAKNFSMAFNSLGFMEMVLKKNKSAAAQYFRRGIELDDQESMFHYGTLLEGGINGQPPDKATAMTYFRRSAAKGQKAACLRVGEAALLNDIPGSGCKDTITYYRYVAEQLPDIGKLLRQGLDKYLSGDWKQSMMGYFYAAESGLALAAFNLALLCEEYEEASNFFNGTCSVYFLNISAELGYSASLVSIGDRYWTGKGIRQDHGKSAVYYARALEKGDSPQAWYSLGYLVENNYNLSGVKFAVLNDGEKAAGNMSLAGLLYQRCMESSYREYEGYYPCLLANVVLKTKLSVNNPIFGFVAAISVPIFLAVAVLTFIAGDDIT